MTEPADELTALRRFARKRFNEHVKLSAGFVNTLALAILGAALVIPLVSTGQLASASVIWVAVGFSLHVLAQLVLRLLRRED